MSTAPRWKIPGVYYAGETPPASVRLAKPRVAKQEELKPSVRAKAARRTHPSTATPERLAQIVALYRATRSMARVRVELRCGVKQIYRALRGAGVEIPPPGSKNLNQYRKAAR